VWRARHSHSISSKFAGDLVCWSFETSTRACARVMGSYLDPVGRRKEWKFHAAWRAASAARAQGSPEGHARGQERLPCRVEPRLSTRTRRIPQFSHMRRPKGPSRISRRDCSICRTSLHVAESGHASKWSVFFRRSCDRGSGVRTLSLRCRAGHGCADHS
jgi:hypothetical protein